MTQPYFLPDPSIEDADLLGYGDLLFDNGTTKYLNGDAELAAGLPRQNIDQPAPVQGTLQPQPIEGSDMSVDPATGNIMSSTSGQVADYLNQTRPQPPGPPGEHAPPGMSREEDLQGQLDQTSGMGAMPQQPIPGTGMQVDPATGSITPSGAPEQQGAAPAQGQYGYGTGGLQLAQRSGALPQEMATQQANERETANTNQMLATYTSRQNEADVYRQAALKRQGELDAERAAQQKQVQEQQDKLQRWQQEQRDTAAMDIKTDLVSAEGGIGSLFSILGAATLGAVGSDAGLRMIDNTIDLNVKKQISMRDSKLHVLADQIGSTEQAIAAGKAQLYKIAADKVEATQQITKADAFEAQTPQILGDLRQKQQLYEQEQQRISLGKTLEKAPVAVAPKAADVQKYGQAAAVQQNALDAAHRLAMAIGANIDPKTGRVANREEVLKNGIPDIGTGSTAAKQLSQIPGIGHIIGAADTALTSKQGLEVRGALKQLMLIQAQLDNPHGRLDNMRMKAEEDVLAIQTPEGVMNALDRAMSKIKDMEESNKATFGPGTAAAYDTNRAAAGGAPLPAGDAAPTRQQLEPGNARQQLQQDRMRPREGLDSAVQEATGQPGPQASNTEQQIKGEEGFRSDAYQDQAGVWTIGFGHTGPEVKQGMTISRGEAQKLLSQDMDTAERAVVDHVDVPLEPAQKQALVDFAFNIGPNAFASSTLLKKLNSGDYQGAAAEFDKWNKITRGGSKVVSQDLVKRRDREQLLFEGQG